MKFASEKPQPNGSLRRPYLFLYDTIPGGAGYLKQLQYPLALGLTTSRFKMLLTPTSRNREAEARERETRRDRCQVRCLAAQVRYQLDPTDDHRRELALALAQLEEYQQVLDQDSADNVPPFDG